MVATEAQLAEARDFRGRFLPGSPGGPGNPYNAHIQALKKAVYDTVLPADMMRMLHAAMTIAVGDDPDASKTDQIAALRLVLEYAIGKPKQSETTVDLPQGIRIVIKRDED